MPKATLDHPRRCQGVFKTGKRGPCMKWALLGTRFCEFHGGRRTRRVIRDTDMPRIYKGNLHANLQEFVAELVDAPSGEQINLFEELAFMRHRASQAVQLYSAAMSAPEGPRRLDTIMSAGNLMADCMKDVAFLADQAAKLNNPNIITAYDVQTAVDHIILMMAEVFGHDPRIATLAQLLKDRLKIKRAPGTDILPDADVLMMDASIPNSGDSDV